MEIAESTRVSKCPDSKLDLSGGGKRVTISADKFTGMISVQLADTGSSPYLYRQLSLEDFNKVLRMGIREWMLKPVAKTTEIDG